MGRGHPEHLSNTQVSAGRLRSKAKRGLAAGLPPVLSQSQESLHQPLPTRSQWALIYTISNFNYQNKVAKINPLPYAWQTVTSKVGEDGGCRYAESDTSVPEYRQKVLHLLL